MSHVLRLSKQQLSSHVFVMVLRSAIHPARLVLVLRGFAPSSSCFGSRRVARYLALSVVGLCVDSPFPPRGFPLFGLGILGGWACGLVRSDRFLFASILVTQPGHRLISRSFLGTGRLLECRASQVWSWHTYTFNGDLELVS